MPTPEDYFDDLVWWIRESGSLLLPVEAGGRAPSGT
jgi:hypothetical protein